MTTHRKRAIAALIAVLTLVLLALAPGASAVDPVSTTSGEGTCRTDGAGYCTVAHTLGKVPTGVQLTPVFGSPAYVLGVVELTATKGLRDPARRRRGGTSARGGGCPSAPTGR